MKADNKIAGLGILTAIAAGWPLLLGFFPQFGAHHFYRMQRRRNVLAAAGILANIAAERRLPLVASILFGALSQILKPERVFVSVDTPETVPAEEATLTDKDLVIGMDVDGVARAWPLQEMIIPHHLANDHIGDRPILVGY